MSPASLSALSDPGVICIVEWVDPTLRDTDPIFTNRLTHSTRWKDLSTTQKDSFRELDIITSSIYLSSTTCRFPLGVFLYRLRVLVYKCFEQWPTIQTQDFDTYKRLWNITDKRSVNVSVHSGLSDESSNTPIYWVIFPIIKNK